MVKLQLSKVTGDLKEKVKFKKLELRKKEQY